MRKFPISSLRCARYRNGLTLNFENGTIYRNVGPQRGEHVSDLSLVMPRHEQRMVVAQAEVTTCSGSYQWGTFVRDVRGEKPANEVTPEEIVAGLQVIEAMSRAEVRKLESNL